jgi:hypothetical protein
LALKGSNETFESPLACLDPVTIILLGKPLVLITLPEVELKVTLFVALNRVSLFENKLLLKALFLFDIPNGEEVRKEAFPVRALLNKEPVAMLSSSSSSPCSSSDEELVVDESSSPLSSLN